MGRAVSLTDELLKHYEHLIEEIKLIPSDGGRFEVTVNEQLLYSKLATRRHAEPGEILGLVRKLVGE
ncbi:MAG TPA: Rdx family protein [Anaerolineales bacterium]|nr:Rdx family protein [Anaerolineales bacterium]